jgi:hypothetical protein
MEFITPLSIILLSAAVHASFQLSISTLTIMSGHTLGRQQSHLRLVRLMSGFLLGAATMTALLLATVVYGAQMLAANTLMLPVVWAAVCGMLFGLGVAVWLFYYRRDKGTVLWLPRKTAEYLATRSKKTKNSAEAFGLGMMSVFGEILFIGAILLVAALIIATLPPAMQLLSGSLYVGVSLLPLLLVAALVGSGHKLSGIQRWREANKHFLQFVAGSSLLVLGFYLYVVEVLSAGGTMNG